MKIKFLLLLIISGLNFLIAKGDFVNKGHIESYVWNKGKQEKDLNVFLEIFNKEEDKWESATLSGNRNKDGRFTIEDAPVYKNSTTFVRTYVIVDNTKYCSDPKGIVNDENTTTMAFTDIIIDSDNKCV